MDTLVEKALEEHNKEQEQRKIDEAKSFIAEIARARAKIVDLEHTIAMYQKGLKELSVKPISADDLLGA